LKLSEATALSFGALSRDALGLLDKDVEVIRQRARAEGVGIGRKLGHAEGYREAKTKYRIAYRCDGCREEIAVVAGSKAAAEAGEAMTELGWGHAACHRRARKT